MQMSFENQIFRQVVTWLLVTLLGGAATVAGWTVKTAYSDHEKIQTIETKLKHIHTDIKFLMKSLKVEHIEDNNGE